MRQFNTWISDERKRSIPSIHKLFLELQVLGDAQLLHGQLADVHPDVLPDAGPRPDSKSDPRRNHDRFLNQLKHAAQKHKKSYQITACRIDRTSTRRQRTKLKGSAISACCYLSSSKNFFQDRRLLDLTGRAGGFELGEQLMALQHSFSLVYIPG